MKKILAITSILFILFTIMPVQAKTIEVGENCTCQTIQDALSIAEEGDLINVHSGIYLINKSIYLKSGIELSGDIYGQTVLYTDSLDDINSIENPAMLYCNNVSNVTIHDIIFKGSAKNLQDQHEKGGKAAIGGLREARNGIKIEGSNNISIYNTRYTLLLSDGIRITNSKNIKIFDSIVDSAGHDSISNFRSSGVTISNCLLSQMINTCVRVDSSEGISISNCTFKPAMDDTGAGYIELEHTADNVSIRNNLFTNSTTPVIFTASPKGGNIFISDNAYSNMGDIQASYSPFTVSKKDNVLASELNASTAKNYGSSKTTKTANISTQKDKNTTKETGAEENMPLTNINATKAQVKEENLFINPNTLNFIIQQTDTASNISRDANNDLLTAKSLLNGTESDKQLGEKYITASEIKIKYAKELLNLSENSLSDARNTSKTPN